MLQAPIEDTIDAWLDLPQIALCGRPFVPSDETWRPDVSEVAIRVSSARESVSNEIQPWLIAALAYYTREYKQSSVACLVEGLRRCARFKLNPLSECDLLSLREELNGSHFSSIRAFVDFWHRCEELPVRPEASLVDGYSQLPRKKSKRLDPVLSLDPERGPFTPFECDALFNWVCGAYIADKISLEQFVYLRLLFIFGARTSNLHQMTFDDFAWTGREFVIRIPYSKQKSPRGGFRQEFATFELSEDLFLLLDSYKRHVLELLKQEYPHSADWDLAIKNVPLFRRTQRNVWDSSCFRRPVIVDSDALRGLETAPNSQFHKPRVAFGWWLRRLSQFEDFPISERTGEKIRLYAHRFRHTVATAMAGEGYGRHAIAAALTHTDSRTAGRYIKTSLQLAKRIDAKLKSELSLVVNAFTGVIVTDRESAHNGARADRQIENLAVCSADSDCYLHAPLACYPCAKFQPLLFADHQRALDELEALQSMSATSDTNTAAVYDRAILACRSVIHECQRILSAKSPHTEAGS